MPEYLFFRPLHYHAPAVFLYRIISCHHVDSILFYGFEPIFSSQNLLNSRNTGEVFNLIHSVVRVKAEIAIFINQINLLPLEYRHVGQDVLDIISLRL